MCCACGNVLAGHVVLEGVYVDERVNGRVSLEKLRLLTSCGLLEVQISYALVLQPR